MLVLANTKKVVMAMLTIFILIVVLTMIKNVAIVAAYLDCNKRNYLSAKSLLHNNAGRIIPLIIKATDYRIGFINVVQRTDSHPIK